MSTSSHMFQTDSVVASSPTQLKNTQINRLTLDDVRQYALDSQQPLSSREEAELVKLFAECAPLQDGATLLDKFIDIQTHFQPLKGLSNKKIEKLRKLVAARKKYKEMIKTEAFDHNTYQAFLQNEKLILPLDQIVQWWIMNSDALKKEQVWQNIANVTIEENKHKNENETVTKHRIETLNALKAEWESHQAFAGFSSENLFEFYDTYVLEMERRLNELLKMKRKFPSVLSQFIVHLLKQLGEIKTEIVHSMLYRLQCAEFYLDSRHDDLLVHILDRIDINCNIHIQLKGKKPEPRRSLKPELLATFIQVIQQHCQQNPSQTHLLEKLKKLKMYTKPSSWEKRNIPSHLAENPIILFAVNTFPELILEAKNTPGLAESILTMDVKSKKTFVLNRLRMHLSNAIREYESKLNSSIITGKDVVATDLRDCEQVLGNLTDEIEMDLCANVNKKIEALIEHTRTSSQLDYDAMLAAVDHAKRLGDFSKLYLGKRYQAASDVIVAVAMNIRHLITHNKRLTPEQCERFVSLITTFYPNMDSDQIAELRFQLQSLPKITYSLHNGSAAQLLHFLINRLEKPFISKRALATPLARHQHIANQQNEKWFEQPPLAESATRKEKHFARLSTYVANVTLPLLEAYPTINLENFDSTTVCVLCEDLKRAASDPKTELSASQVNYLRELRAIFEEAIFKKINDFFAIKDYICTDESKPVDLAKLRELLLKVQKFFGSAENKESMHDNIHRACLSLIKIYFLNLIEKDGTPDMVYVQKINEILGVNLLEELCRDEEIRLVLKTYIRTFDGTKSNLSRLLTALSPLNNLCDCEKYIVGYAKKRLDYLKSSRDLTQEDNYFFLYYRSLPEIDTVFQDCKTKFASEISEMLERSRWSKTHAKIIELFGEPEQIKQYRLKRLLHLLKKEQTEKLDEETSEQLMKDFIATVNQASDRSKPLLDSTTLISEKVSLHDYLDECINHREWTPLLEGVITHFGSPAQLQSLHAKAFMACLDEHRNITDSKLGALLTTALPRSSEIKTMGNSLSQEVVRISLQQLLGDQHLSGICAKLEVMVASIIEINNHLSQQDMLRSEYKRLMKIIGCIKPFTGIYQTYGKNQKTKDTCGQIDEIERKLRLHYELNTVFTQHSYLVDIAKNNATLHNLMMDLVKSIQAIEDKSLLSDKTIDHYLTLCENQILIKIEEALASDAYEPDFATLAVLSNLFFHLTSDKLKMLLVHSHKNQIAADPYWLTLINHIDESRTVATLKHTDTTHDQSFLQVLRFAQRITRIKHQVNQQIKRSLLLEADIPVANTDKINLSELLQGSFVTDQQLLKLWSSCLAKLNKDTLHEKTTPGYIDFICKILTVVTSEIVKRGSTNPALLTKFEERTIELANLKDRLQSLFAKDDKSTKRYSYLWTTESKTDRALRPLLALQEQGKVLQLIQYAEKYALHCLSKSKFDVFREACNDSQFGKLTPPEQIAQIKQKFGLSDKKKTLKVLKALIICQKLSEENKQKHRDSSALHLVQHILTEMNQMGVELKSESYNKFIEGLLKMASPTPSNDPIFAEKAYPSL